MWSVFFLFLSYLDGELVKGDLLGQPLDADKESKVVFHALSDALCTKTSTAGQYSLQQVSDGVQVVQSVRDPTGRLIRCSVSANHTQVSAFMRSCRLGLREQKTTGTTDSELKLTGIVEAKANCEQLQSKDATVVPAHAQSREESQVPGADGAKKLRRSKRGFTYPGTLWCGAGNIADDYDQLGEFAETDKCCRTHDHCPHVIHAFSSNYGYTNFKWHSLSHCDCDNTLKKCLRVVNDTSSRVVGQAFFNVIEVPCFEFAFEEQCVERHWYGVCKRYDRVPIAVIKESIPYDFGGIEVIDVLTLAPPKKKPTKLDEDEEEKKEKEQGSESTTQSSFTGSKSGSPEEPSLTNVVTAAEDFIKVLATVSTSQSSSADNGKGETQASEKKRKKNAGKRKKDSKKSRGKGKGKKRKQSADRVSKAEEVVVGSPSANRSEEVINKNHFVENPGHFDRVSSNKNNGNGNFMAGEFDSVVDRGHSNKMMRDEHQRMPEPEESQGAISSTPNEKQKEEKKEMLETQKQIKETESVQVSSTVNISPTVPSKPRSFRIRQRAERKRQRYLTPTSIPLQTALDNRMGEDNTPLSATESTSLAGQTTHSPISPAGEEVPRSSEYRGEKGSAFIATTQNTPIVATKRLRSRQKGGRKRSRKLSTPSSPIATEVPHASATEEPSGLTTDATQVPTADSSLEPPLSSSERLQQNRLENLEEHLSGEGLTKNRNQRFQSTKNRNQRPQISKPHNPLPTTEDTNYKNKLTTLSRTTILPSLPDKDFQSSPQTKTGQMFLLFSQTSIPSASPLQTKRAKRRRSKERDDKKRRKNKDTET